MEDLETHYDLCIQGTGLVESIVACAAAKCGIKVIHLDQNDYYGGNFSSLNFDTFSQLNSNNVAMEGTEANDSSLTSSNYSLISVIGSSSSSNNHQVSNESTELLPVDTKRRELFTKAMKESRHFSIDLTSKLMLCSGLSVDCFLKSGVSEYLEFKSIEALFYLASSEEVLKVPCSKSDVFNSKLLTAMEKRLLTKFLQFVDDYGREMLGRSAATVNEHELASGRALYRPQNKSFDSSGFRIAEFEDKPFSEFMTFCKIPVSLQTIIVHALSLNIRSTVSYSASEHSRFLVEPLITSIALTQLASVLNSLGRYGDTALLATVYGTAEIVQSFCRMAAVWGATYVLRENVTSIAAYQAVAATEETMKPFIDSTSSSTMIDATKKMPTSQEIENEGEAGPNFPVSEPFEKRLLVTDSHQRSFSCHSFITSIQDFPISFSSSIGEAQPFSIPVHSCLLTRICVLSGLALSQNRSVLVIPPQTRGIDNTHAVIVTQQDASMMVCAEGFFLLHITTIVDCPSNADKSIVWNSPSSIKGTSANNFSWNEYITQMKHDWCALLDRVATTVLTSTIRKESTGHIEAPIEVHYVNSIRPMFSIEKTHASIPSSHISTSHVLPDHIRVVGDDGSNYSLTVDDSVLQAQRLFHTLFPDKEFMFPAKNALAMSETSQFEDEFDEIHYYKSALSPESTVFPSDDNDNKLVAVLSTEGIESRTAANCDDVIYVPMVPRTDI